MPRLIFRDKTFTARCQESVHEMLRGVQKKAEGLLQFCTDAPPSARLLTTENDPHIIWSFIHVHVLTGKYFVSFLLPPQLNSACSADFFFCQRVGSELVKMAVPDFTI